MVVYLLRAYRISHVGVHSLESIAEELKISKKEYWCIEKGNRMPTAMEALGLAALYNIDNGLIMRACRQAQNCQKWRDMASLQAIEIRQMQAELRQSQGKKRNSKSSRKS